MSSFDVTEFESMVSLDKPINSSIATRWERRAARQQSSSSQQASQSDRYIPNRSGMDFDLMMTSDENGDANTTSDHAKLLLANTLENKGDARVLAFKNKAPAPADGYQSSLKVLYSAQSAKKEVAKPTRHIPSAPIRVLDAPDMLDDYCKIFSNSFCQSSNHYPFHRLEFDVLECQQHSRRGFVPMCLSLGCCIW
jgi:cell division cycle protein 20 (cofactor of APC complex)